MITLTAEQAQQIEEVLANLDRAAFNVQNQTQARIALRALNTALKVSHKALATIRAARAQKQAEQEPVAVVEITYGREPECYVTGNIDNFPEGVFKLYAAPVRTKDLTDTELMACRSSDPAGGSWLESARSVIAKFKEKNK